MLNALWEKDPEEYTALDTLTTESLMAERQTVLVSLCSVSAIRQNSVVRCVFLREK